MTSMATRIPTLKQNSFAAQSQLGGTSSCLIPNQTKLPNTVVKMRSNTGRPHIEGLGRLVDGGFMACDGFQLSVAFYCTTAVGRLPPNPAALHHSPLTKFNQPITTYVNGMDQPSPASKLFFRHLRAHARG